MSAYLTTGELAFAVPAGVVLGAVVSYFGTTSAARAAQKAENRRTLSDRRYALYLEVARMCREVNTFRPPVEDFATRYRAMNSDLSLIGSQRVYNAYSLAESNLIHYELVQATRSLSTATSRALGEVPNNDESLTGLVSTLTKSLDALLKAMRTDLDLEDRS